MNAAIPLIFAALLFCVGVYGVLSRRNAVLVLMSVELMLAAVTLNLVTFGTLEIVVRSCHKRPPEEPPESAAFLEVTDIKPNEDPAPLFSGWMFASSPALSALEHPVYDVWVIDCRTAPSPTPADGR